MADPLNHLGIRSAFNDLVLGKKFSVLIETERHHLAFRYQKELAAAGEGYRGTGGQGPHGTDQERSHQKRRDHMKQCFHSIPPINEIVRN
jgi:hypothetical protein